MKLMGFLSNNLVDFLQNFELSLRKTEPKPVI